MRGYDVPAGTKSLLLFSPTPLRSAKGLHDHQWSTREYHTTQDHLFVGEEMVVDPTRIYNGTSGISAYSTPYKLAERGYIVFTTDPDNAQKYLLAVPYASVTIG